VLCNPHRPCTRITIDNVTMEQLGVIFLKNVQNLDIRLLSLPQVIAFLTRSNLMNVTDISLAEKSFHFENTMMALIQPFLKELSANLSLIQNITYLQQLLNAKNHTHHEQIQVYPYMSAPETTNNSTTVTVLIVACVAGLIYIIYSKLMM